MRIEALVVCAILLFSPLTKSLADPLSFDGLTNLATEEGSEPRRRVREFDTSEVDSHLARVKTLVEQLCDSYRSILMLTEEDDGECLKTTSKSRFEELKTKCRHFNNKLDETRNELFLVDRQLDEFGLKDLSRLELMSLSQQIGRQTRYVTIYNSILEFAWERKISYDTRRPFDKETIEFAELNGNSRQCFPDVFDQRRNFHDAKFFDYIKVYRKQPLEELEKETSETFEASRVESLVNEAKDIAARAASIKEHLLSNGNERKKNTMRKIEYSFSADRFEQDIKREQVKYIQMAIELKAIRNEFVMNFILAKDIYPDNNLLLQWVELDGEHHDLIFWGLKTKLVCGSHNSRFFLIKNYRTRFTIPQPATLQEYYREKRQDQLNTLADMRSRGLITTAEAMEILRNTEPAELMQKAVEVTGKIFDLTDKNKAAIKELVDSRMQEYWNDSVSSLPNPSDNSD